MTDRPLKVLLVEDNPDDAELVLRALRREGFQPDHRRVETDRDLRLALIDEPWDLILCDWNLPGFRAPDALEILKASRRDIPFVIVSGVVGEETAVEAMRSGAQDFMGKDNLTRLGAVVARELADSADRRRRREAERALKARDAILTVVGGAADRLVRAAEWKGVVEEILARVGPVTDADLVVVYQNRAQRGGRVGVLELSWPAPAVAATQGLRELDSLRWVELMPVWDLAVRSAGVAVAAADERLSEPARLWMAARDVRSLCVIPVRAGVVWWGAIVVLDRNDRGWTDAEISAMRVLADALGATIERNDLLERLTRSHEELTEAYNRTLEGWARALELRDQETAGHSRRVTELSVRLARALGFDNDNLLHVRRGALLHDIGKMGVPDEILSKQGPLTEEEWAIMRLHPVFAYDLLSSIPYLGPAMEIPYAHHERWDGTGYPRGLAGEDIPLAARIFAIVDVWDAMTTDRPYRPALPPDQVMEYVESQAGSQFDPAVVAAFRRVVGAEGVSSEVPGRSEVVSGRSEEDPGTPPEGAAAGG